LARDCIDHADVPRPVAINKPRRRYADVDQTGGEKHAHLGWIDLGERGCSPCYDRHRLELQAKGDHSTIHTKTASYRKAYKTVTMGPIFDFDTLAAWVEKLETNPYASAYASPPEIFLLPGAGAVKVRGEIGAAIGVGGAPGGDKDELCATADLAKVEDRLPQQRRQCETRGGHRL